MNDKSKKEHQGRCLCGDVRYMATGAPVIVAHCHCEDCQRLTGSGHSTGAMFPDDRFEITGVVGEYKLKSDNGNVVTRVFCPSCGSPLYGRNTGMEGFITLSLGTMNDSAAFKPEVTVFARNCKPWDIVDESTETFDAQPLWDPNKTG